MQQSSSLHLFAAPTRLVGGSGSIRALPEVLEGVGSRTVLVVTDPLLSKAGPMVMVQQVLDKAGVRYGVSTAVEPDPTVAVVQELLAEIKKGGYDLLLAVGGGSAMDTAKAAGILATNGGSIQDYDGNDVFQVPPLPMVAIPTTAGTGSEVSISANITDTATNKKMSIRHQLNPARAAILDPAMVATLSPKQAIYPGLDALSHAVEAYVSLWANPFSDAAAGHAIQLIGRYLRPFIANRADAEAAYAMQTGATLAGMAFTSARTGYVHCLARAIGGAYPVTHGLVCAVLMPVVMAYNQSAAPERFCQIAQWLGADTRGVSSEAGAALAVEAVRQLNTHLGVPQRLSEVGVDRHQISAMADYCVVMQYERWNPQPASREQFVNLFKQVI